MSELVMNPAEAYGELLASYRERALLDSVATALAWDEETYMPARGGEHRAEQHALVARLEHERASDPRLGEWIALAEAGGYPSDAIEAVNLRAWRREHERAVLTPTSLVAELARASTIARVAWEHARDHNDPGGYLPALARVVDLVRAQCDCVRGERTRYDACLEEWEPELAEAEVVQLFASLRPRLVELVNRFETPAGGDDPLACSVALDVQRRLNDMVARWFGFDFERGRIDEAAHPSTMAIGPGDVRLTTRYDEQRPFDALFSTLHELGHGLYDQRLPVEHHSTPAGEARSIAIHESQSRFIENVIGRDRAFWSFALPRLQAIAAPVLDGLAPDPVYRAINRVVRTSCRVKADEVTYDLHIAIRVALERALICGELEVSELSDAWDDAYSALLVRPRDAADGFLQDGHWAAGMFGYFPTYTLGNVIAAQLARAIRTALPDFDAHLATGELAPIVSWLTEHVHRHGGRYSATQLVARLTGGGLDPSAHIDRLVQRYGAA